MSTPFNRVRVHRDVSEGFRWFERLFRFDRFPGRLLSTSSFRPSRAKHFVQESVGTSETRGKSSRDASDAPSLPFVSRYSRAADSPVTGGIGMNKSRRIGAI